MTPQIAIVIFIVALIIMKFLLFREKESSVNYVFAE